METDLGTPRPRASACRLAVAGVVVLAVAVHGSLFWLSYVPQPRTLLGDEIVYWSVARSLAAGDEPEHVLWLWPPLYPRFLAGLIAVFGARPWAVEIVQTLLLLAVVLAIHDLTRQWTGSPLAAAAAAAMALVYPPWVAFAHFFWPEVLHAALFLGALWILARRPPTAGWLAAAGALLGLAVQAKSLLLPFLPILLFLALKGRAADGGVRKSAGRVALVGLGIALAIVPLRLLGGPDTRLVESTVTFNLWVGLNDRSRKERVDPIAVTEYRAYQASAATPRERNEILWRKIRDKVRDEGVVKVLSRQLGRQYFRLFDKDSFLTVQLPAPAPAAAGYHRPSPVLAAFLRGTSFLFYVLILSGAVLGVAVRPPGQKRWLRIALAFLAYNLAIFLVLHVKSRYRIQLLPFLFLYFGCAVAWLGAKLGWNPSESELWKGELTRARGAVTAVGVALFLFLAFSGPML